MNASLSSRNRRNRLRSLRSEGPIIRFGMADIVKRTVSGAGFLAIVLCGLLINKFLFAGLVIFIMAGMMREFYLMTAGGRLELPGILSIATGIILFALIFLSAARYMDARLICLAFIPLFAVMAGALRKGGDREGFGRFPYICTGLLYIAVPLSLSGLMVFDGDGNFGGGLMLCLFIIIWASDVGAYCVGMLLGRNGPKLCPAISPKKSWAGFWGGLVFAVGAAVLIRFAGMSGFPLLHCIVLSILMHVAGVCGDLFESQWKRYFNVKDSGNIIPGHGGLLDRFDSALFAIPAGAVYLTAVGLM